VTVVICEHCGHAHHCGEDAAVDSLRDRCKAEGWPVSGNGTRVREDVVAAIFDCDRQTVRRWRPKGGAVHLPGGWYWPLRGIAKMLEDRTQNLSKPISSDLE
jgi:hypothetical protein